MKNLVLTIAFISLFFNLSSFAQTATAPSSGDGSPGSPYQIASLNNLYWITATDAVVASPTQAARWAASYIQTADIDASTTSTWNSGAGWSPIGNSITNFTGTYNGNSKTISGLSINRVANSQGFFGKTGGGSISNLGLMSININAGGGNCVGGLVSETNNTTISNCYSTGTVVGNQPVGGLIGYQYLGSVSSSYSSCNVTGYSQGSGFAGYSNGLIQNCYSTGNVTRKSGSTFTDLGGFVGWRSGSSTTIKCYSTGRVIYVSGGNPTNKGFIGYNTSTGTFTGNFWDMGTSLQTSTAGTATGKTTLEMKTQSTFTSAGWDFLGESANGVNDYWNTSGGRNDGYPFLTWQTLAAPSGSGTGGAPYQIATLENLYWITASNTDVASPNQVTRWAAYYTQTVNIDASSTSTWNSGQGWTPIGNGSTQFTGTYNGAGYTIDNLYIDRLGTTYCGLFGFILGGSISNVGLTNVNITSGSNSGGLIGESFWGNITNCNASGSVSGTDLVGGLVGDHRGGGTITNCYALGSVDGTYHVGGLVGEFRDVTLSNSYASSNVTATQYNIGGLVGFNSGSINNSYATGTVHGIIIVGGLVGNNGGSITKTYSTGSVTGYTSGVGGLLGNNAGTITNSFWDVTTTGQGLSYGSDETLYGKTTAEMKTNSTFLSAGWDYTIWNIGDGINDGYPYLDWQNPTGTPLPVELSSFSAATIGSTVKLSWNTATEVNNYGFEVERKILKQVQNDKTNWENIGFVNGNGNSNSPKSYSYEDKDLTLGKYSYRLKQIDNDGQFEYSKTVAVDINGVKKFELSQNYPNPFNPITTIKYTVPTVGAENLLPIQLKIYNMLGEEVAILVNTQQPAGNYEVKFDASNLTSGVYFYKIVSGKYSEIKKMILLR